MPNATIAPSAGTEKSGSRSGSASYPASFEEVLSQMEAPRVSVTQRLQAGNSMPLVSPEDHPLQGTPQADLPLVHNPGIGKPFMVPLMIGQAVFGPDGVGHGGIHDKIINGVHGGKGAVFKYFANSLPQIASVENPNVAPSPYCFGGTHIQLHPQDIPNLELFALCKCFDVSKAQISEWCHNSLILIHPNAIRVFSICLEPLYQYLNLDGGRIHPRLGNLYGPMHTFGMGIPQATMGAEGYDISRAHRARWGMAILYVLNRYLMFSQLEQSVLALLSQRGDIFDGPFHQWICADPSSIKLRCAHCLMRPSGRTACCKR